MNRRHWLQHASLVTLSTLPVIGDAAEEKGKKKAKSGKVGTPPPTGAPLKPADIAELPEGTDHLDLYLLIGQSNMKGRGTMPEVPKADPKIVAMHVKNDKWYLARHPLHLTGDPETFAGHDNAGVGSGLAFAETLQSDDATARIGLIPCAVGGTPVKRWVKGADLYENAVRRAKMALAAGPAGKTHIKGAIWLQGEADATPAGLPLYEAQLLNLVDSLRADLALPNLPFIACTIGEFKADERGKDRAAMNAIFMGLPAKRPHTGCVDARDLKGHIGDNVHFDTASQNEIGQRFGKIMIRLAAGA
ncbi:MAG: sialate O-acetylesterase [Verrucomicrobiales bacterium]|nr:sialate O-acetylesterase [Verrucomicrobiales bacterium]MCP5558408.1 sialate O-acetylesterase [Verrucomicrobiaceae bacterium]